MSRTVRGSKGCGYDWWGKRPFSQCSPDRVLKLLTHRIERKNAKRETIKLIEETN